MMDTVYGTKKYFQSLSNGNGSDIYRSSTCRAVNNEYSYQNTFGRRSTIGPYQHMNKHPTYSTDLSSQYGYNTWGIWRDQRNLAPSIYSTKSRQSNVKSFSIILSTAAFIVILAVISVAGLAFYFGTFKSNLDDPIMVFEGNFRVLKGDIYTTGLKYNHTSTYKQKVDYYKRFLERSLMDNGLNIARIDILGFGDGPLIETHFRSFLDMRKVPQNIRSVEEHIRESLLLEISSLKSLYKSIRIDPNSIEVKRIMDDDLVKSASFVRETQPSNSQQHFEKRLTKKTGIVEKSILPKLMTTQKPKPIKTSNIDDEPDIDVENAPVIQGSFEGSFEITKTDADITRKKTVPTKAVTMPTRASVAVTPFPMRVKSKKTTIEKVPSPKLPENKSTSTTTTTTKKLTTTTTTSKKLIATTPSTTELTTKSTTPLTTTIETTIMPEVISKIEKLTNVHDPPKLDVHLFTSAPVLDTEPWRPIRPPNNDINHHKMQQNNPDLLANLNSMFNIPAQSSVEAIESGLLPRNKIKFSDPITDNPNDMLFYHSFTNPVFMPGTSGIERLGNSQVKPHNLPIPLLDDVVIPNFKPLQSATSDTNNPNENGNIFEHIGGGVIVKKHEEDLNDDKPDIVINSTEIFEPESLTETIIIQLPTEDKNLKITPSNDSVMPVTELTEKIGELLLDLLELPNENFNNNTENLEIESRIEPDSLEKPNFLNLKDLILNRNKTTTTTTTTSTLTPTVTTSQKPTISPASSSPLTTTTIKFTTRKHNSRPRPITKKPSNSSRTTPTTIIDDSMLFPTNSKWEYLNGSSNGRNGMKKVFNQTLQAWVVENDEKHDNNYQLQKDSININNNLTKNHTTQIQDISLIFDTLASKLGISPSISAKNPPFSQNKFKQSQRDDTKLKTLSTITTQKIITTTIPTIRTTFTTETNDEIKSDIIISDEQHKILPITSDEIIENLSPELIEGEAEIEIIDPNKYEEMLKVSQAVSTSTESMQTLVTLLPVKSNSGIRTIKTQFNDGGRTFQPFKSQTFKETVVKAGIHVTV